MTSSNGLFPVTDFHCIVKFQESPNVSSDIADSLTTRRLNGASNSSMILVTAFTRGHTTDPKPCGFRLQNKRAARHTQPSTRGLRPGASADPRDLCGPRHLCRPEVIPGPEIFRCLSSETGSPGARCEL